jgi:hypothetical protein
MGTKNNPGQFDCYDKALPDEPMFVLLARDPDFARLIHLWCERRNHDINAGERPVTDRALIIEAYACAADGAKWRRDNLGKWRKP